MSAGQEKGPRRRQTRRLARWARALSALDRVSQVIAAARVSLAVLAIVLLAVAARSDAWRRPAGWAALAAVAGFSGAVAAHRRVHRRREIARGLVSAIEAEILRLDGRWREIPDDGAALGGSALAEDLSLFGRGSLFQMIARCSTPFGQARLAEWLDAGRVPRDLAARQVAVAELAPRVGRRQRLEAVAEAALAEKQSHDVLGRLAAAPSLHDGRPWLAPLGIVAMLITVGQGLAALIFEVPTAFWPCLIAQGLVALALGGRLAREYDSLLAHDRAIASWALALTEAERGRARCERLRSLRAALEGSGPALARLAGTLDLLALRHSSIFWPVNMLLLWDLIVTARLAAWRRAHAARLPGWLDALAELEALGSLAGHASTFDTPIFPSVHAQDGPAWEGVAVAHPLLPRERAVGNDLRLEAEGSLVLLTGSNMSGKSTMLRSVGLNTVLALAGGAVHASRLQLAPCTLMTSIRVTDALDEGVSSFYAEVRRIKTILDALARADAREADPVLFLVDEILRGTNTRERLIASRAIVSRLAAGRAFGIVTSHDISLTELERSVPGVVNAHFREDVAAGRMTFDYTLRPGPVPTTNALTILRLEGIDIPEA